MSCISNLHCNKSLWNIFETETNKEQRFWRSNQVNAELFQYTRNEEVIISKVERVART